MDPTVIAEAANKLRQRRRDLVAAYGYAGVQARAVHALDEIGTLWSDTKYHVRQRAEENSGTFPFKMVSIGLGGLLPSLSESAIRPLISSESLCLRDAPDVIGHVIAGNTPLLSWTSVARALLVGSASLVKVPSSTEAVWVDYFVETLREVAPELVGIVDVLAWKGGTNEGDSQLCEHVDRLVVYGSDATLAAFRDMDQATPIVGYGHMVSAAIVELGSDWAEVATGLATDILMYDQGGCLSPHTIFVEGGAGDAYAFAEILQARLAVDPLSRCLLASSPLRSRRVREARDMAKFEPGAKIWEGESLRWTLVVLPASEFRMSPTHGCVTVVPVDRGDIGRALAPLIGRIQGIAIGASPTDPWSSDCIQKLKFGVSYTCTPGRLQSPPISWRENNLDVLRSLIV